MACAVNKAGDDKKKKKCGVLLWMWGNSTFFNPRRMLKVCCGEDEPFGDQVYRQL